MPSKKPEYQLLKPQEHYITPKPKSKIMLWSLVIIQLLVFTLWVSALLIDTKDEDEIDKFNFVEQDLVFVEEEVLFEDYDENIPLGERSIECSVASDNEKFDCLPESGEEDDCKKRGCCWQPVNIKLGQMGVPWCYYPKNYGGYKLVNSTETKNGIRAFYSRTFPSPYPDDVKLIRADISLISLNTVHIKIIDADSNRYEPPYPDIPIVSDNTINKPMFQFIVDSNGFKVLRNNNDIIFDSHNVGGFIFADQFLQISIKFIGKIYGLGEHQTGFSLNTNWTKFTLYNRDGIPVPNTNLYGSHPFFMELLPNGKAQGVFFHNTNAMDVVLQPLPAITFRSIGGVFDFYLFNGPTPGDVIKQYTEVIGRPFLPPYWSLGYHLSRFGYKNTEDIRKVWSRTREAKIPFDVQWHDIDYMDKRNDFTYDKERYGDLPKFIKEVHGVGMHYIPIIDPGISGCEPNGTYPPYDEGIAADAFIKNEDGSIFVGKVWNPNCTVFPDFTAPNAVSYWSSQIKKYHDQVPFDGIWIDMNEPSNFLSGSFDGCPSNKYENPAFLPDVLNGKLYDTTICMSTRQAAGRHYDVHNLYGMSEAMATNRALQQLGKRPFIISRSTYPGTGKYAGHWTGDVVSTWHSMNISIAQMLSFNLFGIPMVGADICGFNGNTTVFLCNRWSQLGAFYPFSRNHNSDDAIDQDPVALGEEVVNSTRKALNVRYTLLPHLYTLFYKAHTQGETVARPLFFEFWNDPRTHPVYESFLWGCCVLIVPVLKEFATTVPTYLPAARWYDWYTYLGVESNGTDVLLHAPTDTIPVFIRGGVILPTQPPNVTTTLSRKNDIELVVASNSSLDAWGTLFWDDGESLDSLATGQYGTVDFTLTPTNLSSQVTHWGCNEIPKLGSVKILGFVKPIKSMYFNNKEIKFQWNSSSLVLSVAVSHPINLPFVLRWKLVGE